MVESIGTFTQGGVYLCRLSNTKGAEISKVRPCIVLTSRVILKKQPPLLFICPLSKCSQPAFKALHVKLPARDNLHVTSYALVEHCRAISSQRMIQPRLAQVDASELKTILYRLNLMLEMG